MGRELKRVPLDFDYPMNKVWYGYTINNIIPCHIDNDNISYCNECYKMAEIKNVPITSYGCPDYETYFSEVSEKLKELCEIPKGNGYQLWETTTEGSPVSPVFPTLDELCEWCEKNATVFADAKVTKQEWKQMLNDGFVYHKDRNITFI